MTMTKGIIMYWAIACGWVVGFSLLVSIIGWWVIPAMAVATITACCFTAQRLFRGSDNAKHLT